MCQARWRQSAIIVVAASALTGQASQAASAAGGGLRVSVRQGSAARIAVPPPVTAVTSVKPLGPVSRRRGLSVALVDNRLTIAATADAVPARRRITVNATGCTSNGCDRRIRLRVNLTVVTTAAPPGSLRDFTISSPDRVAAAIPMPGAVAGATLRDELLITLGTPESPGQRATAEAAARAVGAVVSGGLVDLGVYELRWKSPQDLEARTEGLRSQTGVSAVSPSNVGTVALFRDPPDDWKDDGVLHTWHMDLIRARQAWNTTTGSDVKLGILDGSAGIGTHEDLNVASEDGIVSIQKYKDHATHVSGLACGRANGIGLVGAAWDCPISLHGVGTEGTDKDILREAEELADEGVKVVNISMGEGLEGPDAGRCMNESEASTIGINALVGYSAFQQLFGGSKGRNIVWTIATGNNCGERGPQSPYGYTAKLLDNVVGVASINSDRTLARSSTSGSGTKIAAPGGAYYGGSGTELGGVWSATRAPGQYGEKQGTSMAAPIVAGVAALVRSAHPTFTAAQAVDCITGADGYYGDTTVRSPQPAALKPLAEFSGPIPIVDAEASVACGAPPPPMPPTGPSGGAAGDPHLSTFDDLLYDMQAAGEFQFAASTTDSFVVQARTQLSGSVSYVDEFAVRTPANQVIVYDAAGVRVDGVPLSAGETRSLLGGGTVTTNAVQLADGTTVSWAARSTARSLRVHLASARAGHMRGLLGDGDGASANDGKTSDGRQILGPGALDGLSQDQVDAVLYDDFSSSWIVSDTGRLFSGDRRPFAKPIVPQPFSQFTEEQIATARELCAAKGWVEPELSLCTYDVLVTGDSQFADAAFRLGATSTSTSTGGEPSLTRDADGDGHPAASDCNENDATVYPGAPEVAEDGIDQDCDNADLVTAMPQVITFEALPNVLYRPGPLTLTATASSGLPVAYEASGPCMVTGVSLTLRGVGSCSITAKQAGNARFAPASPVVRDFTVGKASTVVSAQPIRVSGKRRIRAAIATLISAETREPISGATMSLRTGGSNGQPAVTICTSATDNSGAVRCLIRPGAERVALKTGKFTATYNGNERYTGSSDSAPVCKRPGPLAPACPR